MFSKKYLLFFREKSENKGTFGENCLLGAVTLSKFWGTVKEKV